MDLILMNVILVTLVLLGLAVAWRLLKQDLVGLLRKGGKIRVCKKAKGDLYGLEKELAESYPGARIVETVVFGDDLIIFLEQF